MFCQTLHVFSTLKSFFILKLFICLEFWNKYFFKEKAMTVLEKGAEILSDESYGQKNPQNSKQNSPLVFMQ